MRYGRKDPICFPKEKWAVIPGHGGHYQISDLGRVRATWILGCSVNNHGRAMVSLGRRPDAHLFQVHRLVMVAFNGPCPSGLVVRHKNGDSLDNRLENWEYGTPSENERDKFRHGKKALGSRAPQSKLTEDQVRDIRLRFAAGEPRQNLAREFHVSDTLISLIVKRKTWAWLPDRKGEA